MHVNLLVNYIIQHVSIDQPDYNDYMQPYGVRDKHMV